MCLVRIDLTIRLTSENTSAFERGRTRCSHPAGGYDDGSSEAPPDPSCLILDSSSFMPTTKAGALDYTTATLGVCGSVLHTHNRLRFTELRGNKTTAHLCLWRCRQEPASWPATPAGQSPPSERSPRSPSPARISICPSRARLAPPPRPRPPIHPIKQQCRPKEERSRRESAIRDTDIRAGRVKER